MNGEIFAPVALWLFGHHTVLFVTLFVTELFDVISFAILAGTLIGYFVIQGRMKNALMVFWSSAIAGVGVYLLKHLFEAPRPSWAIYQLDDPGFPSGHSTIAMTIALLLWITRPKKLNPVTSAAIILAPLIIGLTRLSLGVHFPKDVLAGFGLGAVSVLISWFLCRHLRDRVPRRKPWFPKMIFILGSATWIMAAIFSSIMIWREIILK